MPRIRLLLAVTLALMLTPLLSSSMPAMPGSPIGVGLLVINELIIGIFIGMLVRILMSSMHVAGTIIANQSSLAIASIFDPNIGGQSVIVANFFTLTAITLVFALNLHHLMLGAIINSYSAFPAGIWPSTLDMQTLISKTASEAFMVGVQFAMPQIILSLIVYLIGGVMARLMPNFQVFFVAMPAQILLALILIAVILSPMMLIYMNHLQERMLEWTAPIG
jgi:flagellar biosynthetic protein FliR